MTEKSAYQADDHGAGGAATPHYQQTANRRLGGITAALYVVVVVLANVLTSHYGLVAVGFGLMATAGTYCAGAALVLRDVVQRQIGRLWSVAIIVVGSALSYALADPHVATASLCAFAVSETVDFAVYTPLRKRGFLIAATVSVVIAAVVDTVVFLRIAGFPVTRLGVEGQMVGKAYALMIVLAVAGVAQVRTRQTVAA